MVELYRRRFEHYGHGSADQAIVGLGGKVFMRPSSQDAVAEFRPYFEPRPRLRARPLTAATVPTAVFAASEDWGTGGAVHRGLAARLDRAAKELAEFIANARRRATTDLFAEPTPSNSSSMGPDPRRRGDRHRAGQARLSAAYFPPRAASGYRGMDRRPG